jgi:hypothetical protein
VTGLSVVRNLVLVGAAVVVAGGWDAGRHGSGLIVGRLAGMAVGIVVVAAERLSTLDRRAQGH